jgi:ABC-type amino acid transport system permease subunit
VLGLAEVRTRQWGGLAITGIIAVHGLALGYPLALGRRSELTLMRCFCTAVIECVRGVPLISPLFMAAIMFIGVLDVFTTQRAATRTGPASRPRPIPSQRASMPSSASR